MIQKLWPGLLMSLFSSVFAFAMSGRLPDRVASHWGPDFVADGWMSRTAYLLTFPALLFGVAAVCYFAPTWDTRRGNFRMHESAYWVLINLTLVFLAFTHIVVTGVNLGWSVDLSIILYGISALLIVFGNLMTRIRPNTIFGVRTPWTLASDRSWRETHRLSGYGAVLLGMVLLVVSAVRPQASYIVLIGGLVALGVSSAAYSYVVWKGDESRSN